MSLVWERETWWTEHIAAVTRGTPWWSVKRSEADPAMLAYFSSREKAERGIYTQIKPGRYLNTYCSAWLTPKQIKYWSEWQAKGTEPTDHDDLPTVHFARTPDEIEHVYVHGPASCMSGAHKFESSEHPVRVYGAGDLAIAWLRGNGGDDDIIARAICWPDRKIFGRVYPTVDEEGYADTLKEALHALGYQHVHQSNGPGLDGARLLRIEEDGAFIMPYLDAPNQYFDEDGKYLRLRREGEFDGTETCGLVRIRSRYEYTCDHCEEGFNDNGSTVYLRANENGGYRDQYWCRYCVEINTFWCEGFEETFANYNLSSDEWNGSTYSQAWLDAHTFISDFSGDRFHDDDMVNMVNGDVWSQDEFDEHGVILDGENWPSDDAEAEMERRAAAQDEKQETMAL